MISAWPALRTLVAPVAAAAHLETRVSIDAGAARLPADIETIAYRVAQEALTNVVACRPRFVTVDVRLGAGRVRRQIADDGRGVGACEARATASSACGSAPLCGPGSSRSHRVLAVALG
jgi:signal transduction histidine kinase